MNSYGSRKFIVAALSLVSASALCWYGCIADGVYSAVVISVCASYMAANVIEKKQA